MSFIKFVRIFLLVLIIVGLILLATQKWWVPKLVDAILASEGVGEVSSGTNTSAWKTYSNSQYGFQIQYPSHWFVKDHDSQIIFSDVSTATALSNEDPGAYADFSVDIDQNENPNKLSIDKWYEQNVGFVSSGSELISVDGIPAIKGIPSEGAVPSVHYFVEAGTNIIDFGFLSQQEQYADIYKQMLASIKFTSQSTENIVTSSQDSSLNILNSLTALYPQIKWGVPVANDYENYHGYETVSPSLDQNYQDFWSFYDQKLKALGWTPDIQHQAGGAGASINPYTKGNQYLVLEYHTDFQGTQLNAPVQCPCKYTYSIFVGTE